MDFYIDFRDHFGTILEPKMVFEGVSQSIKKFIDFLLILASILGSLWTPFGLPLGSLWRPFGHPICRLILKGATWALRTPPNRSTVRPGHPKVEPKIQKMSQKAPPE